MSQSSNFKESKILRSPRRSTRDVVSLPPKVVTDGSASNAPVISSPRKGRGRSAGIHAAKNNTSFTRSDNDEVAKKKRKSSFGEGPKKLARSKDLKELGSEESDNGESEDDESGSYEIEAIIGHRISGKKCIYTVSWVGYVGETTEMKEEELANATEILQKYKADHKLFDKPTSDGSARRGKSRKSANHQDSDDIVAVKKRVLSKHLKKLGNEENDSEESENDETGYEIEAIVSHRLSGKKTFYTVAWVGYPGETTELTEDKFANASEILMKYKAANNLSDKPASDGSARRGRPSKSSTHQGSDDISSSIVLKTPARAGRTVHHAVVKGDDESSPAPGSFNRTKKKYGCDKGFKIKDIQHFSVDNNEPSVTVIYANNSSEVVPTRIVREKEPNMLIQYYENCLIKMELGDA